MPNTGHSDHEKDSPLDSVGVNSLDLALEGHPKLGEHLRLGRPDESRTSYGKSIRDLGDSNGASFLAIGTDLGHATALAALYHKPSAVRQSRSLSGKTNSPKTAVSTASIRDSTWNG